MLILGDESHHHGRFPWVTAALVVVNVVVFAAQVFIGEPLTNGFSLVPEEIVTCHDIVGTKYLKVKPPDYVDRKGHHHIHFETQVPIKHYHGPFPIFLTLFTSVFMHGSIAHLIGNMWFLLIFGRNVECAFGHGRFIVFYLACGLCAGLAHVAADPHSIIPCLGASGAISGILGAYISIHPLNKIKIWLGLLWGVIEVPALIVIGLWFALQYVSAIMALEDDVHTGVAYWAHIGGFVGGFVLLRGYIMYLQHQVAYAPVEEDIPVGNAPDILANAMPVAATAQSQKTVVAAGAPDPFANFLSVQTIRNMAQQKSTTETS